MNPIIAEHMPEIEAACKEFGVLRLELFGSAATDSFDPETSDFDFLVEFAPNDIMRRTFGQYFGFQERLQSILGRNVDLVEAGVSRNPYFLRAVEASRRLLYAA